MSPLLSIRGVTKQYGPVTVLDDVDLEVAGGEIHGLLGANGAGKSTLCKIIAGLVPASGGAMQVEGVDHRPASKASAEAVGVEIVQQELNLIPTLSVAENLLLTRLPNIGGIIRRGELVTRAQRALDRFGIDDVDPHTIVGTLGVGKQQMIEIAAALDRRCRLLILDEPTASLSAGESAKLFECLRSLRQQGIGILYISHRLEEVAELSDRITVLRDGKRVCTRPTTSLTTDGMVELMSGETGTPSGSFRSHITSILAMRVNGLGDEVVRPVSFDVQRGERLGIAGLVGSGRTELLQLIFGAKPAGAGTIQMGDRSPVRLTHPAQAVAVGLAMVTEDRKDNGLLLAQSIRSNMSLASLRNQFSLGGLVRRGAEDDAANRMVSRLGIRCNAIEQTAGTLSGGNQQKVAIAKWLVRDAEVFLLDEPTRGIDVPARQRVHELIASLAQAGKAVVIVSSDLDELLETCDRIGVMSSGRWMGEYKRPWDREAIMRASFAGYQAGAA